MAEERFRQLGDTHIVDKVTGEEYYAPSETGLVELLNSLNNQLYCAQCSLIYEYSTNITEDMEELKKDLYGDVE